LDTDPAVKPGDILESKSSGKLVRYDGPGYPRGHFSGTVVGNNKNGPPGVFRIGDKMGDWWFGAFKLTTVPSLAQ
jgi:hypothetical protein